MTNKEASEVLKSGGFVWDIFPRLKPSIRKAIEVLENENDWIPIETRPLTEEEKEEYPDYAIMYDCCLPEDGEEVLITTKYGVRTDTFYRDEEGCYFESYCDEGEVLAWKPLPKPYKE